MAEIVLTPAAVRDMEAIWQYTRDKWSVAQADAYVDHVAAAFAALARAPLTAPACAQIRPGYRRGVVERHVIYFKVVESGIVVVRVLHERMDANQAL